MSYYTQHWFDLADKTLNDKLLTILNDKYDGGFYIDKNGIITDEMSNCGMGWSGVFLWTELEDIVQELGEVNMNVHCKVTENDEHHGEIFGWRVMDGAVIEN